MLEIDPNDISIKELHKYLLSSIGPRPIALASTIDVNGVNNVSPFSFFNVFSANPPILIFSPARRVRNNTTKDTLENVKKIKEVVINIVNEKIAEKMSLTSGEYPSEIDEFVKAGLTPIISKKIKPKRVKESPVQLECKVNQIIELGKEGGAGNLIICEVIFIHIHSSILNEKNEIEQDKIQLIGRLGNNWYCKAFDQALFEIQKPTEKMGIGLDRIPERIRKSYIFNQNDLAKLASVSNIPSNHEIEKFREKDIIKLLLQGENDEEIREVLHKKAKEEIDKNEIEKAWKFLLIDKLNQKL